MNIIHVASDGNLKCRGKSYRCALGRGGIVVDKLEGDGGTPLGRFPIRHVYYRQDKVAIPDTRLEVTALEENFGWCDDPNCQAYNQFVHLPHSGSHEKLWRDDDIYDVIVVLGHNDDPVEKNKGSAIFMHVARENYTSTEGCVALSLDDLREVLNSITPGDEIEITAD